MKILILALLVVGTAAWPDRRRPGPSDRPARPPFGRPPPPRGERPPFLPDGAFPPFGGRPTGGAGDEEWIPPFDDPEFGMEDDGFMRPTGRPPCRRPGKPNSGETDPETEPEGSAQGPDEGSRGDRTIRRTPGSGRQRERPDRPQRGGRGRRPQGEKPKNGKPGGRRIKPFKGKRLNPEDMEKREFFPIFTAENVTLQNGNEIPLNEGDNAFLLPMGPRRRGPEKPGENAPQELFGYGYGGIVPYLNIKYNPSSTPTVSFEYGVTQFFG
ncbi:basic salivary proline-rich protein 2-like [Anguilla rostrata]|uniref:basic salivary proline-rich protein 2-like n=1 Tax=Anguilla rostrata TaxID=7938 RepID=UPI0030D2DC4B